MGELGIHALIQDRGGGDGGRGKAYVIAGFWQDWGELVEQYDPATDRWRRRARAYGKVLDDREIRFLHASDCDLETRIRMNICWGSS